MAKFSEIKNIFKSTMGEDQPKSNELDIMEKMFQVLNSEEFGAQLEKNLQNQEIDIEKEVVEKSLNIITMLIKQMKKKNKVNSISITMESYEFPFPPFVTILTEDDEIELDTESIEPKELHYELDALSSDYNTEYTEQTEMILNTYQKIISELNQYNWNSVCDISDDFEIEFIKP